MSDTAYVTQAQFETALNRIDELEKTVEQKDERVDKPEERLDTAARGATVIHQLR